MNYYQKQERKINFIILIALILIPVSLCFNNSVWLDEGFSLRWSAMPFQEMMNRLINDVHPPLYYFMLRTVLKLTGNSLLAAKLFSVTGFSLMLLLGYLFVRKQFGIKAMYFYWLFLLCTPMMLKKTVEVRMYTWAYLFVLLSVVEMYYLLNKSSRENWIKFTVFSLCAAYTQYFALLTMVFVYAVIIIYFVFTKKWKETRNWLICSLATIVAYLPWLPIAVRQMQGNGASWITKPTSRLGLIRELFNTRLPWTENVLLIVVILMMGIALFLFLKNRDAKSYWILACMVPLWGCLIFGLIYSEIYKPIIISRYLMIPLCILILGCSAVSDYLPKIVVGAMCVLFILVGWITYQNVYLEEYNTLTDETLSFAEGNIKEGDIIVTDAGSLSSVIPYYFPTAGSVSDIYTDDYEYLWYFENTSSLNIVKLKESGIACENKGQFGFDNVYFTIYYLYRLP